MQFVVLQDKNVPSFILKSIFLLSGFCQLFFKYRNPPLYRRGISRV